MMARFGQRSCRIAALSCVSALAKPCARFVQKTGATRGLVSAGRRHPRQIVIALGPGALADALRDLDNDAADAKMGSW